MTKEIMSESFNNELRIEQMVHIPTMCATQPVSDIVEDFFSDHWEQVWECLGLTPENEWEDISTYLYNNEKFGFLALIATPVPGHFIEEQSYSYSWGHYHTRVFYEDSIEAIFEEALKWQREWIALKFKKSQSKEA